MTTSGVRTSPRVVALPDVAQLTAVSDEELLEMQRQSGAVRRQVDAVVAAISGELARRSDRSLGHSGLASRTGAASPEKAVQKLTGVSFPEARALVAAGSTPQSPWLAPVTAALEAGEISVASAAAIARGLGSPSDDVASDDLLDAASQLVGFALESTPENTATAARHRREQLDVAHIVDIEEYRRSRRSLTWSPQADGMTRITALLDPESAAIITGALDTVLSPRRGPRFVDPDEQKRRDAAAHDPRTLPQHAVDALVDIVLLAGRVANSDFDPSKLFGSSSPAVRVHVQASDLKRGTGFSYIEGQSAFLSLATAERLACGSGWLPVLFDGQRPIDVGSTQRLHSTRQRIALAAYWNGCAWGECDRPPSMTEAHHIEAWNGSNTTLANGVSLCRFHHMELHNNGWTVQRSGGELWADPPVEHRHVGRIPLRPRSPFAHRGVSGRAAPSVMEWKNDAQQ